MVVEACFGAGTGTGTGAGTVAIAGSGDCATAKPVPLLQALAAVF